MDSWETSPGRSVRLLKLRSRETRFGLRREPREGCKAASTYLRIESYSPEAKTEIKIIFPQHKLC